MNIIYIYNTPYKIMILTSFFRSLRNQQTVEVSEKNQKTTIFNNDFLYGN